MTSPLANLADQTADLLATITGLASIEQLREAEPSITGKRSILSALQKSFGVLAPEDRREAGPSCKSPASRGSGVGRAPARVESSRARPEPS